MRQLLVFALARVKNLRVTEADDGVDGLRKLASGGYDIILTDINMPIMDGLKLVRRVRSDPTHKDVPIIIITTESTQDRRRALELGANACITKPIQAPQVIAKVRELLRSRASRKRRDADDLGTEVFRRVHAREQRLRRGLASEDERTERVEVAPLVFALASAKARRSRPPSAIVTTASASFWSGAPRNVDRSPKSMTSRRNAATSSCVTSPSVASSSSSARGS